MSSEDDAPVDICWLADGDDGLNQRGDGRDESPAEHKVQHPEAGFPCVEVMHPDPAQEQGKEDIGNLLLPVLDVHIDRLPALGLHAFLHFVFHDFPS